MVSILTNREIEVIDKKLKNKKLTQQDSNYLSKFIRPKLKEIISIDASLLLNKLRYDPKIIPIEKKIKQIILKTVKNVDSIILYGSAIQNNYKDYNDIDILVVVRKRSWEKLGQKYQKILEIKKLAKKKKLNLDIKIFSEKDIQKSYPNNIVLIYELKDSKIIYGAFLFSNKININKLDLKTQIDYSYFLLLDLKEEGLNEIESREIYSAIRNLWTVQMITRKIVDNQYLNKIINSELGENLVNSLKQNSASLVQRKIAKLYLEDLYKKTEKLIENIEEIKWERKE